MNAVRRYTTLVVLFVLFPGQVGEAQNTTKPRPRLVLVIVADQFRSDYLSRFGPLFGKNGLRRLMREGATWTNANFDYVPTKTAPGHTAIMTGAPPAVTGIIANEWIDRSTAKKVTAVGDIGARLLGGGPTESASSPWRLLASTVGDELRLATGEAAKVIGISEPNSKKKNGCDRSQPTKAPTGRRTPGSLLTTRVNDRVGFAYEFGGPCFSRLVPFVVP